jgi:hypothetical protein
VANATLFIFLSQIDIGTSTIHSAYSKFACGLHGGVDVKWTGGSLVLELH